MRKCLVIGLLFVLVSLPSVQARAQAETGKEAPPFTLMSTEGKWVSLTNFPGQYVVLEWTNPDCPFVKKHYMSGNMQRLQKRYTGQGVAWLTINSSAEGKQGNYPPEKWNEYIKATNMSSIAVLLDVQGNVGKAYGAKTTPHMFVINPDRIVIYAGAIDNKPTFDVKDVAEAQNYVEAALEQALSGKRVETASVQPYGCSVKY